MLQPELMDDPALDAAAHTKALRGLRRLNRISSSTAIVWREIADLLHEGRPVKVLDLATGGGDVPIALWQKARKTKLPPHISGCDVSDVAVDFARTEANRAGASVEFFTLNALTGEIPSGYDVITCSLFLHHLHDEQCVTLLRRMAGAAKRRVVVNDLLRSPLNAALVWLGAHAVTTSRIVHIDAMRSIRAALDLSEAKSLAEKAGLGNAAVTSRPLCRFVLTWNKP